MIKYSVILPIYKDRKRQFKLALKAYAEQTYTKEQFELIVIDQGNDENVEELFTNYGLHIKHIKIDLHKAGYPGGQNPSYAQNVAFKYAKGDFIVLTSPEVVFENEAFAKFDKLITNHNIIYATVGETKHIDEKVLYTSKYLVSKKTGMWLCHPNTRKLPMCYFMAVLPKKPIFDIGAVDEDFMSAIGYEDDDFGRRLQMKLQPIYTDKIIGAHISHSRSYQQGDGMTKVNIGGKLFRNKKIQKPYPVMANQNRVWGDPKGITEITDYDKGKKVVHESEQDLVTVFTSCFNQAEYLELAIQSVLKQTYTNFEYLLYDDGSTDNTWDIMMKYAQKDSRIIPTQLPKQPNVGYVLNKSIQSSQGKFWSWCPSDDLWEPNILEENWKLSRNHNHKACIWTDWNIINEKGVTIDFREPKLNTPQSIWDEVWKRAPIGFCGIWVPLEVYNQVGLYPEHLAKSEDYYWFVNACINKVPFWRNPQRLFKTRVHTNRLSSRNATDLLDGAERIRQDLKKKYNL